MSSAHSQTLDTGIAIIHANKLEELRDVVEYWLRQHPLAPLEQEVLLVQSNGMGQWLKQNLAHNRALGIAAGIRMELPSKFIWEMYRAILGQDIPVEQPLAKAPLIWRLYRLLPGLITQAEFSNLAKFLADDHDSRKRYQLAEQLADLFDQYQVYRSDWISAWTAGQDCLRNVSGEEIPLPTNQRWQAVLWRAILQDLGVKNSSFASRAAVHAQFMQNVDQCARPAKLPRRIILFGLSSLPQQALEVFAKLGRFSQIVLFVHNPCQHYWADIVEDKELLKAERRRQAYKPGMTASLSAEELHLHSPPLLAAWGKQGRDYIRLLDLFDERQQYENWHWPQQKIDLFSDYGAPGQRSLLQQLQQAILDLEPLPSEPVSIAHTDDSLAFHIAHSAQREVEILHDQLLARFADAKAQGKHLAPRDIIVMVPDINQYAPHIRAVFGLHTPEQQDKRYIPYSIADQQQRGQNPLLLALEVLLNLPESRFTVSELLSLLEVPALRARFDLEAAALPKLQQWIEEAGIRWGLNAEQRRTRVADMPASAANTWQFGLQRMLLGYAVGAGQAYADIEPYAEIGGLDAQWLGGLAFLLESLEHYCQVLQQARTAAAWVSTLNTLLADFFSVSSERDSKTLQTLVSSLDKWAAQCAQADLQPSDTLPINVVRDAWLDAFDEPSLQQSFLNGRVNFCTLMPMRAIPFQVVCLLGMNDGDYPRNQAAPSFDLMQQRGQYRPGDRSRRQDDHYLFLEALLSARQQLYVSWIGRSIRDNSERPPSLLISQLREVISQSWQLADGQALLAALTVEHPLQPFSADYVLPTRDPRLFTYAKEWYQPAAAPTPSPSSVAESTAATLSVSQESLARFLKAPVQSFCQQTLKFSFEHDSYTSEDNEPFAFDHLQHYLLRDHLLQCLLATAPDDLDSYLSLQYQTYARQGKLPLGGFARASFDSLSAPVKQSWLHYQQLRQVWCTPLEAQALQIQFTLPADISVQLTGAVDQLLRNAAAETAIFQVSAQNLLDSKQNIKHANLLLAWVRHLLACSNGLAAQSIIVAADCVLHIPNFGIKQAHDELLRLVAACYQGLQAPLPVACKTALVLLTAEENPLQQAQESYEGNEWNRGEVDYDAYLTRFFPTFADLQAPTPQNFAYWAPLLYRVLITSVQRYPSTEEAI